MNYFYRLRYSLYTFFGLIPDVAKIEEKREKIRNEFNRLNKIGSSEKLQKYIDLDQFINSKDYKDRKKAIEAQKYRGSEAYHKEKRYKKLARSSKIKTYYKVKDSADLKFLKEFKDSDKLNKFLELKKYFKSEKFPADKEQIKKERQKKINDLKSKKKEYQTLKRKFRWYEKLKNNRKFNDFLHFKDSDTFIQYLELEEEVKNYSLKEVKTRYKTRQKELKSEKKRLEKRYKQLEKQARKANKKKKPFPNEQELERLKETMAEGKYDKMIRDADYKQAIEYVKIQQFKELRKNKRIRTAAAFYHSENYRRYLEVQGSDELNRYEELKNYINQQYKKDLQNAKAHTYKNSEIYRQYQEYKQLKADKDIKRYLKFENSRKYKIFTELNNSELIEEYENLRTAEGGENFGTVYARVPLRKSFNPYKGKKTKISAKGLKNIMFGRSNIDLSAVEQIVDQSQTNAIADAIYYTIKKHYINNEKSMIEIINQLEKDGIIRGYHADVNYEKIDRWLINLFKCSAKVQDRSKLARKALAVNGVVNVREVMTGEGDLHVKAVGEDPDDLVRIAGELVNIGLEIEDEDLIQNEHFHPYHQFGPQGEKREPIIDFRRLTGNSETADLTIHEGVPVAGKTIKKINQLGLLDRDALLVAIEREENIITPRGDVVIKPGDIVSIFSPSGLKKETLSNFTDKKSLNE